MQSLQLTEFGIRGSVLPASEVLRQATVNSARVLHQRRGGPQAVTTTILSPEKEGNGNSDGNEDEGEEAEAELEFGIIKEGAYADLLVMKENPVDDEFGADVMERFWVEDNDSDNDNEAVSVAGAEADEDEDDDNDDDEEWEKMGPKGKETQIQKKAQKQKENKNQKKKNKKRQSGLAVLKEGRVVWSLLGEGLGVDLVYR